MKHNQSNFEHIVNTLKTFLDGENEFNTHYQCDQIKLHYNTVNFIFEMVSNIVLYEIDINEFERELNTNFETNNLFYFESVSNIMHCIRMILDANQPSQDVFITNEYDAQDRLRNVESNQNPENSRYYYQIKVYPTYLNYINRIAIYYFVYFFAYLFAHLYVISLISLTFTQSLVFLTVKPIITCALITSLGLTILGKPNTRKRNFSKSNVQTISSPEEFQREFRKYLFKTTIKIRIAMLASQLKEKIISK